MTEINKRLCTKCFGDKQIVGAGYMKIACPKCLGCGWEVIEESIEISRDLEKKFQGVFIEDSTVCVDEPVIDEVSNDVVIEDVKLSHKAELAGRRRGRPRKK